MGNPYIGLFALKDLREGAELWYYYGVRCESWQQVSYFKSWFYCVKLPYKCRENREHA